MLAASASFVEAAAAQSTPPNIQLGDTEYAIEFKSGVFSENLGELQAQPWYATNNFTLAANAARQVFDCAAGSPFDQPTCATPFSAFDNISAGFGGLSPWFVYDVEAGVAATAVGFSDVTGGQNVLRQVNTNLAAEQPFAIATLATLPTPPNVAPSETESIPEPTAAIALLAVGAVMAGSALRRR